MGNIKKSIIKHIVIMIGIVAILTFCILYPFLPGEYDLLAQPVSFFVQGFAGISLLFSIVGILWLTMPAKHYAFTTAVLYLSTFITAVLSFFVFLAESKIIGITLFLAWAIIFLRLKNKLCTSKKTVPNLFNFIPLYLIVLPVVILIIQLVLTKPVTQWSRSNAIENAEELIRLLEDFHSKYGRYPETLQAMHKDYHPRIAGIEKYHYSPIGDSYNISFEQPKFLFDEIGTREWVVYNPKDEHRVYSHTRDFLLLSPEELERSQGWYASGNAGHSHWKYFLFD